MNIEIDLNSWRKTTNARTRRTAADMNQFSPRGEPRNRAVGSVPSQVCPGGCRFQHRLAWGDVVSFNMWSKVLKMLSLLRRHGTPMKGTPTTARRKPALAHSFLNALWVAHGRGAFQSEGRAKKSGSQVQKVL